MTRIEKLDHVLNWFATSSFDKGGIEVDDIKRLIPEISELDELNRILNKLVKDAYIDAHKKEETFDAIFGKKVITTIRYQTTFEGYIFAEQGGYKAEIKQANAESTRLIAVENQTLLLTLILAVGALIASVYYVVELYWQHGWFH